MQKKHTLQENVSQDSGNALPNADTHRPTQESLTDAALIIDTQKREAQKSHKTMQPEKRASRKVAGGDDRLSTDGTSVPMHDLPSDKEFAAGASRHPETNESMCSCSEIMSKDPICCVPSDTVDLVARLMATENIGAIPVVHDLRESLLIGIVTDRDLALKVVAEGYDPKTVTVGEVMAQEPMACRADSNILLALNAMAEHQLRRIPIIDENHRLVGIIAQADVAARLAQPAQTARVVEEISQSNIEHNTADRRQESRASNESAQTELIS